MTELALFITVTAGILDGASLEAGTRWPVWAHPVCYVVTLAAVVVSFLLLERRGS